MFNFIDTIKNRHPISVSKHTISRYCERFLKIKVSDFDIYQNARGFP